MMCNTCKAPADCILTLLNIILCLDSDLESVRSILVFKDALMKPRLLVLTVNGCVNACKEKNGLREKREVRKRHCSVTVLCELPQ